MSTILDVIINDKKEEVQANKAKTPLASLKETAMYHRIASSLKKQLLDETQLGVIAEIKRKSPSKGDINKNIVILDTAIGYENAGASAISVLTDNKYFGGSLDDLVTVKENINIPLLRKDFMIDPYQIYESKAFGADLILLIAQALTPRQCFNLATLSKKLGLEVLLEIHNKEEIKTHLNPFITFVGINNRDLKTFKVDINRSFELMKHMPQQYLKISESGINDVNILVKLKKNGFSGFLMGEYFMKNKQPENTCRIFITDCCKQLQK